MSLNALYDKVSEFEKKLSEEALNLSQCRKGCSRCCFTDISVFQLEADAITSWFNGLPEERKSEIRSLWSRSQQPEACAFLRDDICTIYEVRPMICRTQGLALYFKENAEALIDICPLNESMLETLTNYEYLNLDLLNMILSQLEKLESGNKNRERIKLRTLQELL